LDLSVHPADRNDLTDASQSCGNIRAGDLVMRDLGYYGIEVFKHFEQEKAFFPGKLKSNTGVYDMKGKKICFQTLYRKMLDNKPDFMQLDVSAGKKHRMPVRMILYPVDEQTCQKRIRNREKESKKWGAPAYRPAEFLYCIPVHWRG
jgi:hypothetical protein